MNLTVNLVTTGIFFGNPSIYMNIYHSDLVIRLTVFELSRNWAGVLWKTDIACKTYSKLKTFHNRRIHSLHLPVDMHGIRACSCYKIIFQNLWNPIPLIRLQGTISSRKSAWKSDFHRISFDLFFQTFKSITDGCYGLWKRQGKNISSKSRKDGIFTLSQGNFHTEKKQRKSDIFTKWLQ